MELNPTTFVLEVINFLILVALLKHWFYKPVLESIDRRRAAMAAEAAAAEALKAEAQALRQQYEDRLEAWEQERNQAREQLRQELRQEKELLKTDLEAEREKARAAGLRESESVRAGYQTQALEQGAVFVSRLLARLARPEVEAGLVEMALEDIASLDASVLGAVRSNGKVMVTSAFELSPEQQRRLGSLLGPVDFERDPELLAGLRIEGGTRFLGANLRDELALFVEAANGR